MRECVTASNRRRLPNRFARRFISDETGKAGAPRSAVQREQRVIELGNLLFELFDPTHCIRQCGSQLDIRVLPAIQIFDHVSHAGAVQCQLVQKYSQK